MLQKCVLAHPTNVDKRIYNEHRNQPAVVLVGRRSHHGILEFTRLSSDWLRGHIRRRAARWRFLLGIPGSAPKEAAGNIDAYVQKLDGPEKLLSALARMIAARPMAASAASGAK